MAAQETLKFSFYTKRAYVPNVSHAFSEYIHHT